MIDFRTDSGLLDREERQRVSIKLVSPLFASEIPFGDHTYSVTISDTPGNRTKLGFPALVRARGEREVSGELLLLGNPWARGIIQASSSGNGRIKISMIMGAADAAEKLKALRLRDTDMGGPRGLAANPNAVYELKTTVTAPNTLSIGINGTIYSVAWNAGESSLTGVSRLAQEISQNAPGVNGSAVGTSPVRLSLSVTTAGVPLAISSAGNWNFISQSTATTHMDTVSQAPIGTFPYCFPVIYNPVAYNEQNDQYLGCVNLFDPQVGEHVANENQGFNFTRTTVTPCVSVPFAIERIWETIGYQLISVLQGPDFVPLHIYNNVLLDELDSGNGVNVFKNSFDLKDHLPQDIDAVEFMAEIAKLFNLAIDPDPYRQQANIYPKTDVLTADIIDWRDYSTPQYSVSHPSPNGGKVYEYEPDGNDGYYQRATIFTGRIKTGKGEKEFKSKFAPLGEFTNKDPLNDDAWKTPRIDQAAVSDAFDLGESDYAPRLMLYLGLQNNSQGDAFPYAGATGLAPNGSRVHPWSLGWTTGDGLHVNFHEDWDTAIEDAPEIVMEMDMPSAALMNLQWNKRYMVQLDEGAVSCVLKNVSVNASDETLDVQAVFVYPKP